MLRNGDKTGLIDKLKSGEIQLSATVESKSQHGGDIREVSVDTTTTGFPTTPIGKASELFNELTITIGTGGTFATGVENTTMTYSVVDLQGEAVYTDELITGFYQSIGSGIMAKFTTGVYVAGDSWILEVHGEVLPQKGLSFIQMRRT